MSGLKFKPISPVCRNDGNDLRHGGAYTRDLVHLT